VSGHSPRAWSLIAVTLAGLLGPLALAAAPIDVVRDCAANASAQITGAEGLNAACPGLADALQTLGLDRMLYDGWRERLNRDALRDVAKLAADYGGSRPRARPNAAALPGILKGLARDQAPAPKSWWDAFRAWLKTWLEGHDADSLSWLDHWLESLRQSATILNAIVYSLIGLVLIAAAWVVVNELKAAGLMAGRNRAAPIPRATAAGGVSAIADVEPIALSDRVIVLLRLLVNRLMQTGRLQAERSLTHRELVSRSAFDSESQRAAFAAVASAAESVLYGPHGAPPERLSSVLHEGQALLAQLPDSSSPH
jgi:hypothetical protein